MLKHFSYQSNAIANAPLSVRSNRSIPIFIPDNYNPHREEPYHVVFFLGGWGGKSIKYFYDDSAFGHSLGKNAPEAMIKGEIPEALLVFPDGTTPYGHSQYVNSPAFGNFLDYLGEEIPRFLFKNFHVANDPKHWAVTGHSSGGFGALWLAVHFPERFGVVCASAADSYFEISIKPSIVSAIPEIEKAGGVQAFLEKFLSHPAPASLGGNSFLTMLSLSLASCYAPNSNKKPLYGDLFFDLHTGEINEEVWNQWLSYDPINWIKKKETEILKLHRIRLECGLQDEYAAQLGHRQISKQLSEMGAHHELIEYSGKHGGQSWRFFDRLKWSLKDS